jgi:hypothetical protein
MVSIILPLAFTSTSYNIVRKERSSNGGGAVPDLPIGSIGLNIGPQDLWGQSA